MLFLLIAFYFYKNLLFSSILYTTLHIVFNHNFDSYANKNHATDDAEA